MMYMKAMHFRYFIELTAAESVTKNVPPSIIFQFVMIAFAISFSTGSEFEGFLVF